jgi:HEAT repeat protein
MPDGTEDRERLDSFRDQVYRQIAAAEILGRLAEPSSIESLFRVLLDPNIADVHPSALRALLRIGRPALPVAVRLLRGQDEALVRFSARATQAAPEAPVASYRRVAALVLGTLGRAEAIEPLIEVLSQVQRDSDRAFLARELTMLPSTPASVQAFKKAYEQMSPDTRLESGSAREALAASMMRFFDPSVVPWIATQLSHVQGDPADKALEQAMLVTTALHLALPGQLPLLSKMVADFGTASEQDILAGLEELFATCEDQLACYLAYIVRPESQTGPQQFVGTKAATLLGVLGDPSVRDALVDQLGSVQNPAIYRAAIRAVDHLSPRGSPTAIGRIRELLGRGGGASADDSLELLMLRLTVRSQR